MAKDINPPRGMRDFLPVDKAKRDEVLSRIRSVYKALGFQEIETPALEDIGRLTSGDGGDNEKLAFRVMKRGEELAAAEGGPLDSYADLGLRYDLTVPLTRYYATNRASLPTVFKAIQTGPVWRAERPQKGRYRQFVQCDIDIIGDASEFAEVELLVASLDALSAIGLSSASIRVNSRSLLAASIAALGVSSADALSAMITIDKLDKVGVSGVAAELSSKFGSDVGSAATAWLSSLDASVPSSLVSLFAAVDSVHAGKLVYDPTLVRGMGYYTGTIFEISYEGASGSIGGGGRYDGMVGKWLGVDVPAVGISIGFERAVDLVSSEFGGTGVVLVCSDMSNGLAIQRALIAAGDIVRIERKPNNVKALLASMAAQGFTRFAFVDSETTVASLELRSID